MKAGTVSTKSTATRSRPSSPRNASLSHRNANGGDSTFQAGARPSKRKHLNNEGAAQRKAKKARTEPREADVRPLRRNRVLEPSPESDSTPRLPTINRAPAETLSVLVFGNGDAGELGLGPAVQEAARPRPNPFLDPGNPSALHVVQLACGGMHTVALTRDNRVVTWGVNDNGALGRDTEWEGGLRDLDGDPEEDGELNPLESTPTPIPATSFPPKTNLVQVAAGDSCSFVLTDTGDVYGWGTFKNAEGKERFARDAKEQIVQKQATPTRIHSLRNITQLACGANHALALDVNGVAWTWGCNEQNQLGRHSSGRHAADPLTPDTLKIRDIKLIACGDYHSLAVDKKGQVWGWGLNSFGEAGYAKAAGSDDVLLPYPMRIPSLRGKGVVCLAGGAHHSAAVTADGQCLVWGRLDGGQLGIAFSPEQLQDPSLIRYDERNKPRICLRPTPVLSIGKVSHVACGTDHTIFISNEGAAYATGFNCQGQLGLGRDEDDVEVAQQITGKAVKDRVLVWAGAGGQFSVVAARAT